MRRTQITVDDGQWVEAGDLLSTGSAFPADILGSKPGVALGVPGHRHDGQGRGQGLAAGRRRDRGRHLAALAAAAGRPPAPGDREAAMQVTPAQRFHAPEATRDPSTKTELYLVREVQNVYRSQGVDINDKHIELIVRQMLRKVRVDDPGGTHFLHGQMVDKPVLYRENTRAAERIREQLLEKRESRRVHRRRQRDRARGRRAFRRSSSRSSSASRRPRWPPSRSCRRPPSRRPRRSSPTRRSRARSTACAGSRRT